MSGIQKSSGLVGITELLRKDALDPKVNLQKTEERILNKADSNDKQSEGGNSVISHKSNLDDIYQLAKDLNIKIDGLGPDNVSKASKTRHTLLDKLDKLSEPSSSSSSSTPPRRSHKRSSVPPSRSRKQVSQSSSSESNSRSRDNNKGVLQHFDAPVHPKASTSYAHNVEDYNFPVKHSKKTTAMTEEQVKREHIENVIGNIRSETRNTFSTDMERNQDMKASKLEQIASIKMTLNEEGIDTSMIALPTIQSSMEEVDSTLNLLLMKNNRYRYSSLAEEVISAGAEVLESVFDGTRNVPVFNISPDYTGFEIGSQKASCQLDPSSVIGKTVEALVPAFLDFRDMLRC